MKKVGAIIFAIICVAGSAVAQSSIAYFDGPSFSLPLWAGRDFDLNRDGLADFHFWNDGAIATADIPVSFVSWIYYAESSPSNQFLVDANRFASFQTNGAAIGPATPQGSIWNAPGLEIVVTTYDSELHNGTTWSGSLGLLGEGYLGVQQTAQDGVHYGWIHMRLPNMTPDTNGLFEFSPVVLDWAFETRPNVAILAGAKPAILPLAQPDISHPGFLTLRWPADLGQTYSVQYKANVGDPFWTNLGLEIVGNATNGIADVPISGNTRFYRVVGAD